MEGWSEVASHGILMNAATYDVREEVLKTWDGHEVIDTSICQAKFA